MIKKITKNICYVLAPILLITMFAYYRANNIPTTIFVREGEQLKSEKLIKFTTKKGKKDSVREVWQKNVQDKEVNISLLGMIPIKSVSVKAVNKDIILYPGGQPVGVKLNTKGVLVVALSDIDAEGGKIKSPATLAGIEIGDNIIKINGNIINNSEDTVTNINSSSENELTIIIDRNGKEIEKKVKPVKGMDNSYKIGLWVRDSTAGVGTLTFYEDKSKTFAALGHPITDIDTGTILKINSGEIVPSSITSVKKGLKGNPGELKGIFTDENLILGEIKKNTQCGIFGQGSDKLINRNAKGMNIALKNEIKEGSAKILTTIDGNEPKYYSIEIEKLLTQEEPGPKSMIIKVTDEELLSKTGGIVQGMSGSPIIQENKIVGAVTHVLINKPNVGYGIYIEWMLKDANIIK